MKNSIDIPDRLARRKVRSRFRPQSSLGVIAERRYLRQNMPAAMMRACARRGLAFDVICPQSGRFDPAAGILTSADGQRFDLRRYDTIVSRNRSGLGLSMLSYAEGAGALTINRPSAIERVRNKADMAIALESAGIPTPPTILTANIAALAGLADDWFPLILKATYGDNSQGLRVIREREDLADIHWNDDPVLAQKFLPGDGMDLKLYVCGDEVFAVHKASPIGAALYAAPERITADRAMIDLALRAGSVFGLEIFGVDALETADGIKVVEVNDFPNFTGVAEAADRLVDLLLSRRGAPRMDTAVEQVR
ncbi:MAG TPA: ATP-grasp domain-containing protein [Verrucomicrobiae bacterium]|jgi:ribosomal protein S6--L-glutamate ligase|nr:ATP-grasp domain-containing protein [Verrucomicrobiae bacterium]